MISHGQPTGTVLDRIVANKREALLKAQRKHPLGNVRRAAEAAGPRSDFYAALSVPGVSLITEMKRASASAGSLAPDLIPAVMAQTFIDGGAAAISVLTEADHFSGSLADLREVKAVASLRGVPVMEKDFVFSEYQVYEAAAHGADAVLLIIAILDPDQYSDLLGLAQSLGLGVLVEVFNGSELDTALTEDPRIVGINNRNLKTLETDISVFESLAPQVPRDKLLVAESGMKNADDVRRMQAAGAQAVLIGESLMRAGGSVSELVSELAG
ncbi:MAG: indole-3-glycerol phosphate synthase TrpC [Chloroflexi bacterium]|nr:indole-3-glycerol phosphate synthase TrpC [Chloroflexota bacterium]